MKKVFAFLVLITFALGLFAVATFSPEAQARAGQLEALTPGIQARQSAELAQDLARANYWQGVRLWLFGTFAPPVAMTGHILLYGVAFAVMVGCLWLMLLAGDKYARVSTFTTETFDIQGLKLVLVKYRLGRGKDKKEGIRVLEVGTGARGDFLLDAPASLEQAHLTALLLKAASEVEIEKARGKAGTRVY